MGGVTEATRDGADKVCARRHLFCCYLAAGHKNDPFCCVICQSLFYLDSHHYRTNPSPRQQVDLFRGCFSILTRKDCNGLFSYFLELKRESSIPGMCCQQDRTVFILTKCLSFWLERSFIILNSKYNVKPASFNKGGNILMCSFFFSELM